MWQKIVIKISDATTTDKYKITALSGVGQICKIMWTSGNSVYTGNCVLVKL